MLLSKYNAPIRGIREDEGMAKRPVGKAKLKAWREHATVEMEGPMAAVALELFLLSGNEQERLELMGVMKERHDALSEIERAK